MPKKLLLVDGSNHAYRAQFALPPRHTSDGVPTRLLYGFTLLLQKMMRTWNPDYVAVAFDPRLTFRNEMFPEYKAQRAEMPEDMRKQWPLLPDLVRAFGYEVVAADGFEADDVLGTLAHQFASADVHAFFVTSDKDFGQLVNDHTFILNESKDEMWDAAAVTEKFGVPPSKMIDMLGLAGDSSDNIPGVPGVGGKTAVQLLEAWGDMEGILSAAKRGEIKGKRGEMLVTHAADARLSRVLATIRTDVPLGLSLEDLAPKGLQEDQVRDLFDRWEFGTVARKLIPKHNAVVASEARLVVNQADLDAIVPELRAAKAVAFELRRVEGGDRLAPEWLGLGLCWGSDRSAYLAVDGGEWDRAQALAAIKALAQDAAIPKITSDAKELWIALKSIGAELQGLVGDTRLLDYVLVPHLKAHGIEELAQRHLGHNQLSLDPGPGAPPAQAGKAAAERAQLVLVIHDKLVSRLDENTGRVYRTIELPLVAVLGRMEVAGILLDTARLGAIRKDIQKRVEETEAECHKLAGKTFRVSSNAEVGTVLFEDLGLPTGKKTKTGWSTDASVLETLTEMHPLPQAILDWRGLSKLESTYLKTLPGFVGKDGRIHTNFNQAVAATGRLASNDPNLQNIPIRTFEGRRIRDAFIADFGKVFVSADYSQVELRVLAHYSHSKPMIESFKAKVDIHRRTASEVFGIPLADVTSEQRSAAKAINFGLLYGMSAFRLARDLQIPREKAQQYMDDYFGRMPEVRGWIDESKAACKKDGFVETLFGRRRLIPEIYAANHNERMGAEREAVNTRVQGTAADIVKIAMIRVDERLRERGLKARMLLQVHDELLLEVPEAEVEAVKALVAAEMMGAADLLVPLEVNLSVGRTWSEAHG